MKKKIYKIFAASVAMAVAVACSDFLDVSVNNQLDATAFYETDEDAEAAIIAVYDVLQWDHFNDWSAPIMLKTMPSDESTAGGASAGDQPNFVALDTYNYDGSNAVIDAAWNVSYFGIYRANLVIDNVEDNSAVKQRVIAEAKALRAYFYFELVTLFGDVPIILHELTPSEYDQSRAPAADVWTQIETDLTEAAAALPSKSQYSPADQFRMSSGAAYAYLGKAHVYQQEWGAAIAAFNNIIGGEYDLEPDYAVLFAKEGELGIESIFEAVYSGTSGYSWGNGNPWYLGAESNLHVQLMGAREEYFSGVDTLNNGWGFNYPTAKLYQAYVDAGDTKRRENTVMSQAEFEAAGGVVTNVANAFDYNGFIRRKYGAYSTEADPGGTAQLSYGNNWRLMRYADVLLLAAEAELQGGSASNALTYINQVRNRALLAPLASVTLADIQTERMLEFAFEGFRWLDCIRWGIAAQEFTGFTANKHELLPIPNDELLQAPNLAPNNPGW